jgi:hypothetical protein
VPLPGGLGGEEGVEDAILDVRRDPLAAVLDDQLGIVAGLELAERFRFADFSDSGVHAELATARHGIAGVDDEVHDDLLELAGVQMNRATCVQLRAQLDVLGDQAMQHFLELADRLVEVQQLWVADLSSAEGEQLTRQSTSSLGAAFDLLQVREHGPGRQSRELELGHRQLGVAEDRGQDVVEVVRHAACEQSDRLELLRVQQLFVQLLRAVAFADVARDAEQTDHLALVVVDRGLGRVDDALFAGDATAEHRSMGLTAEDQEIYLLDLCGVQLGEELGIGRSEKLIVGAAEKLHQRPVAAHVAQRTILDVDRVLHGVEQGPGQRAIGEELGRDFAFLPAGHLGSGAG